MEKKDAEQPSNKQVFLEKQNKLKRLDLKVDHHAQKKNIERMIKAKADSQEVYQVMYTKHLTQKQKIWEEGLFIYDLKTLKGTLYNDRERTDCTQIIDTKYLRIKPDFDDDETFRLNKFLVQIESR